jgi:peroxiredoxin
MTSSNASILSRYVVFAFLALASTGGAVASPTVRDTKGEKREPLADRGQKATVLFFVMHDCPIANSYAPELARIAADYGSRGIEFFAVYCTETPQEAAAHLAEYRIPFTGLSDPKLQLARRAGATVVPEAAVFSRTGELLYRGRIDDRAVRFGAVRPEPRRRDLRLALDAVLAGRKVAPRFTTAVGCYLPTDEPSNK